MRSAFSSSCHHSQSTSTVMSMITSKPAVPDSPEVAAACRDTAEASLRYSKHHMDFIIEHGMPCSVIDANAAIRPDKPSGIPVLFKQLPSSSGFAGCGCADKHRCFSLFDMPQDPVQCNPDYCIIIQIQRFIDETSIITISFFDDSITAVLITMQSRNLRKYEELLYASISRNGCARMTSPCQRSFMLSSISLRFP